MTDQTVWQTAPLHATVDHVLSRFHDTHRAQIERILPLLDKVSSVHADTFPAELVLVVQHLGDELQMHMQKEERVLFPMIKQGMGRNAAMPVRVMMMEHDDHSATIEQVLSLTDNLTPPAQACGSWQRLYAELRELVDDLQQHIQLENHILFPRTLAE